jgi:AraC family transcriptional regulator
MRLYREFQQRDSVTSLMLEGLVLELIATMSRYKTSDAQRRLPRWLRQARDLLHDRFSESLSIDEIATAVSVHPSHLMDGFRQHYGCTPGDYIRRLRVEYATHLLCASDMSASQIAFAAGFSDQSHFCRTFKAFTRMTPTEFKNAAR